MRAVITLHGIRTHGEWQKKIAPVLSKAGFIPYPLDYGYFLVAQLARKASRENKLNWLLSEYEKIAKNDDRPSVIAHSFGTYLLGALIEKYPQVTFDKIIFCGSIVRCDYDWPTVLADRRVNYVENDYGGLDVWPKLAKQFISGAGSAGRDGFSKTHPALNQREFALYKHSDYFSELNVEREWLPTLSLPIRQVLDYLLGATIFVAHFLKVDPSNVRANIFTRPSKSAEHIRIVPGMHVNMTSANGTNPRELLVTIPIGHEPPFSVPGAGEAFDLRKPTRCLYRKIRGRIT